MPLLMTAKVGKSLPVHPTCVSCGAAANCRSPKQLSPRKTADIVFVTGGVEVDGDNGIIRSPYSRLDALCKRVGVDLASHAVVPASACFGASEEAWKHCSPLVASELARLQPKVVIPVGGKATQSVIGRYWQHPAELFDRWYGYKIPCQQLNAWICPIGTLSPQKRQGEVSGMWAFRWLRDASRIQRRPWEHGVPNINQCVTTYTNPRDISRFLGEAAKLPLSAFDYETTGLKPEWDNQKIWSMSVAYVQDGELRSVAFPVQKQHHDLIRGYLTSPGKKIAANMKFEARWSKQKLGVTVNNWYWDTMQAAHIEDPRNGVTGLKFQAFARLGIPFFADEVEQYFSSEENQKLNTISQAPLLPLLTYNAIDSAAELLLASVQMVEAGLIKNHFVPEKYLPCR